MVGNALATIGLILDILGVALLLAGPRVHPRGANPMFLGSDIEGDTRLRRTWSKLGRFGLPTVAVGFTLQILGTWADELSWTSLAPLIGVVIPSVFIVSYLVVRQLPYEE